MDQQIIDKTVLTFKKQALDALPDLINEIYLFGSCARGDYKDDSDIDVLVILDCSSRKLHQLKYKLLDISDELSLDNDVVLSLIVRDKNDWEKNKDFLLLYKNVLAEGKCCYGKQVS